MESIEDIGFPVKTSNIREYSKLIIAGRAKRNCFKSEEGGD